MSLALSVLAVAPSCAGNTDDAVKRGGGLRPVRARHHAVCDDARSATRRSTACSIAAPRFAPSIRKAGPALVVFGSAASLRRRDPHATQFRSTPACASSPARPRATPRRQVDRRSAARPRHQRVTTTASRSRSSTPAIAPHADLPLSRIRAYKDFVSGGRTPVDSCGHGTHVAGIVAGSGAHSNGVYAGIAPDVDIVALRVLGDDCSGNTSDVIDALEWIARHHETYQIKVVNISLGHARARVDLHRSARAGGRAPVAQGHCGRHRRRQQGRQPARLGDPGYGGVGVPCNAPSAICVGSLDTLGTPDLSDDRVSDSSSRGPTRFDLLAKPDLVAPGVNIVSLAARGSRLFNEFAHLRVPGANRQAGILRAVGHEHGVAGGGRRGGAAARENHAAARSTP